MTMKNTVRLLALAGLACAFLISPSSTVAQDQPPQQNNRGRGGPGGPGGPGGQRTTPEEMRKRMTDRLRDLMEVKDDAEWQLLEPRIQKVMEINRDTRFSSMSILFSQPGENRDGGKSSRFGGGSTPPEVDDLRKAIEGKAGEGDVKVRLERLREARKSKEAAIEQAQDELRKLLTAKQEAVAVLVGLLK